MEMKITFEGKAKVNAEFNGMIIKTDQPLPHGDNTAPNPFDLFLASLGTCAGIFVKMFCDRRGISTEDIQIIQTINGYDSVKNLITDITIDIQLPATFPEKYRDAVLSAADLCKVKRHLAEPPTIKTITSVR